MNLVLFSRPKGSDLVGKIRLFNKDIELSLQVKYLGVTLDGNLNWIAHVKDRVQKAMPVSVEKSQVFRISMYQIGYIDSSIFSAHCLLLTEELLTIRCELLIY